jgi:hypothetical protein
MYLVEFSVKEAFRRHEKIGMKCIIASGGLPFTKG